MRSRRRLENDLIDEAPTPVLAAFQAAHDGMSRAVEVLCCMLPRRIVATADVPAGQAKTQMHPACPRFQAFLAAGRSMGLNVVDLIEMRAP